jgi:hypothetical protein
MTVAMAAFNAVMDAEPDQPRHHRDRGAGGGLVYAYKHSETFRAVVDTTFKVILKKVVPPVIGFVVRS